ncbi:hypothetical protein F4805DRAFT_464151 [Annulohypoxylon moriforme]|nr:hypothetical protein F4805DRAFT_464151 [Annulohypoxylon moriforme]
MCCTKHPREATLGGGNTLSLTVRPMRNEEAASSTLEIFNSFNWVHGLEPRAKRFEQL